MSALGRLTATLSRGIAGQRKNRYAVEQDTFDQERRLAVEADNRAYRDAMIENQRQQVEGLNQQRLALQMQQQREAQAKAKEYHDRLALLARKGVNPADIPAIARDETLFRERVSPKSTPEQELAQYEAKARIDARYRAPTQGPTPVVWTDAQGNPVLIDPRSGKVVARPDAGLRPPVSAAQQQPTEGERRIGALYAFAEPAAQRVLKKYSEGFTPSTVDRAGEALKGSWRPDWVGSLLQSDDAQMMYDDLTNVVLATQYALSGAAVTEPEARKLARGLMPSLGDKPGRAAQKIEEINNRMRVLRQAAGRGMSQTAPQRPPLSAMPPAQ